MKITINHDACRHSGEFADRCLAASLRNPYARERYCLATVEDDGSDDVTVDLTLDGRTYTRVFLSERERQIAADQGWEAFVHPTAVAG
ncbi:MAG TPA: hypothetical protein VLD63_14405 [Anaerolineales bacterium]|nr:hypothetical protein [Anaerolineales bacterium]